MIGKIIRRHLSTNSIPIYMKEFFEQRSQTKCFDQILNSKVEKKFFKKYFQLFFLMDSSGRLLVLLKIKDRVYLKLK